MAKMRRQAPGQAARMFVERLRGDMDAEDVVKREEEGEGGEGKGEGSVLEGVVNVERRGEVERMWRRGVDGLEGLGDITGVMARLERAERAMDVVEGV